MQSQGLPYPSSARHGSPQEAPIPCYGHLHSWDAGGLHVHQIQSARCAVHWTPSYNAQIPISTGPPFQLHAILLPASSLEARIHSRHASAYDHWIHGAHLRLMAWLQEDAAGRTWDEIADGYDRELRTDEFLMGLNLFRRWLVRQAKVQSSPPDMMNLISQLLHTWRTERQVPKSHAHKCASITNSARCLRSGGRELAWLEISQSRLSPD